MEKVSGYVLKIISVFMAIFMALLVIFTFFQVLSRFVFKISIAWSEEIIRMNFVWMIFLGSAIAVKTKGHLVMDMFTGYLKGKAKTIANILILVFIIAIYCVLFVSGTQYCIRSIGKTAVTMPIPANCVYISAPLSALFGIFFAIERITEELKYMKEAKP